MGKYKASREGEKTHPDMEPRVQIWVNLQRANTTIEYSVKEK